MNVKKYQTGVMAELMAAESSALHHRNAFNFKINVNRKHLL